jgi:hypothetical protein
LNVRFWTWPLAVFVLVLAAPMTSAAQASAVTEHVSFSQQILEAHNTYRASVGVPPLVWSDELVYAAQVWANSLSSDLQFAHDPSVRNQGENLWMGTAGAFTLTQMVDDWGRERRYFKSGTFPDVSTTANWSDVGHYTQMVWKNTTSVGCFGRTGSDGYYRLVCRYSPAGNIIGQRIF